MANNKKKITIGFLVLITALLSACDIQVISSDDIIASQVADAIEDALDDATATPEPTYTPYPTYTPAPTYTAQPRVYYNYNNYDYNINRQPPPNTNNQPPRMPDGRDQPDGPRPPRID